jgi:hypothetical protein
MSDDKHPDTWLIKANKGWQQRADSEKIRADSAERWAFEASTEAGRLGRSRQLWRRLTISAWSYFGGYTSIVSLHWSRWVYVGSGLLTAVVTASIETIEARRARQKRAAKRQADRQAFLAEQRQGKAADQ